MMAMSKHAGKYYRDRKDFAGDNIRLSKKDAAFIRSLPDFDMAMLLSEIDNYGWSSAKKIIPLIEESVARAGVAEVKSKT
jgi:hypothetical protein